MNSKSGTGSRTSSGSRQPLLWAALAFASGIVAGVYLWRPAVWWLAAAIFFCAFGAYFLRARTPAASALALAALFAAGALTIQTRGSEDFGDDSTAPLPADQEVMVTGRVANDGQLLQAGFGEARQMLDIETEQISAGDRTLAMRAGLRVSFYDKDPGNPSRDASAGDAAAPRANAFHYGDRLRFVTKLYAPRNFRDPGAFDYRGYLAEKGITLLGATKAASVEVLPGFSGNRPELWRTRIRQSILEKTHSLWLAPEAGTLDAILLGEESFLGRELKGDFQRSGTYHVLVVSGLKVGILALAVFWLVRRLRVGEVAAASIAIVFTLSYALLTAAGTPVWRATLMLILYLGARLLYRQKSMLNAIGAAALALLLVDPSQLLGASFQLSFLCILVIAAIAMPLLERTTQPYSRSLRHLDSAGYDGSLPPGKAQWRLDLRMIAGRLARFLGAGFALNLISLGLRLLFWSADFFLLSAVLQAGLTLPMAYYFHRATIVALPANLLVVPLTELAMVSASVAIGLGYISLHLARIPALLAGLALQSVNGAVRGLGSLRLADARVPTPSVTAILIGAASLILAMILIRRRPWLATTGALVLAGSAFWICAVPPRLRMRAGELEVTTLDVGQGDSILLVTPQGRTVLVDAGGMPQWTHSELDIGEDVVSPYLWSREISRLDAVAITHAHADHIGGMRAILDNFHPRELWLGVDSPSPELQSVLREARDLGIRIISYHAGESVEMGGASIRILAPARDAAKRLSHANDDCLVMKVSFAGTSALLEADAERATERQIAEQQPQADLLKVAHHGSATSTIPELLAAVRPRFAVISVGARNVYGHPRQEVLRRLGESNAATYRTDLDGAVTFLLDGKGVVPAAADFP